MKWKKGIDITESNEREGKHIYTLSKRYGGYYMIFRREEFIPHKEWVKNKNKKLKHYYALYHDKGGCSSKRLKASFKFLKSAKACVELMEMG